MGERGQFTRIYIKARKTMEQVIAGNGPIPLSYFKIASANSSRGIGANTAIEHCTAVNSRRQQQLAGKQRYQW
ncbi:hypothetical protein C0039_18430 [Pseudohalioglobus lutimaris]|uniref:Uncharacterized protein n=1 Tax=Pseudohalioglobus lutimaris TaxID=1737061 RepID=A0A2N5WY24_9GAMM|nr:hypothetical protein C0039_18430 [Pseudohalioglobus lutimaris]